MTKKKMAVYEKKLRNRRQELLRQVLSQDDDIGDMRDDHSADPLDMAGLASSLELMSALGNNERLELTEIDHALGKIESKNFGTCEGCESGIKQARLDAIPTARYCMTCQEEHERNPMVADRPKRRVLTSDDLPMSGDEDS